MAKNSKLTSNVKENFKKSLKFLVYIIISVYLLIWVFSPFVFKYLISDYLHDAYSLELSNKTEIRYNPFTSHLTIEDLEIAESGIVYFKLDSLEIEVRLYRLIFNEVYLSELALDGLFLNIESSEDSLRIAGIRFASSSENVAAEKDTAMKDSVSINDGYHILVPALSIKNADFKYQQMNTSHLLSLNALELTQLAYSQRETLVSLDAKALIDGAPLEFRFDVSLSSGEDQSSGFGHGKIGLNIVLNNFSLENISDLISNDSQQIAGLLSFSSAHQIEINGTQIDIDTDGVELKIDDIVYKDDSRSYIQSSQTILLGEIKSVLDLKAEELIKSVAIESIKLIASESEYKQSDLKLSNVGYSLTLSNATLIASEDKGQMLSLERASFDIKELTFKQPGTQLTSAGERIVIDKLQISDEKLSIEEIAFDGLNAEFLLQAIDGSDELEASDKQISKSKTTTEKVSAKRTEIGKKQQAIESVAIVIDLINFTNSQSIKFTDETVRPAFSQSVLINELSLAELDSNSPEKQSPIKISGTNGEYTKFDFDGFIKPFTKSINLAVKGELTELALPPANPYIEKTLGFQFESGELDTKVDFKISNSKITGNSNVLIKGLVLAATENYDQNLLLEQSAMPLNVALGMLKDRDDNVELDIPLTGDLNSPAFGLSSFIGLVTKKAIQATATSYLMKTFLPYAEVISMTISAGDFILKTRFEDLKYSSGRTEFESSQDNYLQQFISLMKDKKDTRVKVCAVSTSNDLSENFKQRSKEDRVSQLKAISKERMDLFKTFMVENEIESARILLCAPALDLDSRDKGRITISV